jgi:hypothetical protein
MLFQSDLNLFHEAKEFINHSNALLIIVPFIKLHTLEEILKDTNNCNQIIVRWQPKDLIEGSSDLEIYDFCKKNAISLYRNPRIHLKAIIDDNNRCFMGSMNISQRALNHPTSDYYNYELATIVENLSFMNKFYFQRILQESMLVTDTLFNRIKDQVQNAKPINEFEDVDFNLPIACDNFLISSLPMSYDLSTIKKVYLSSVANNEEEMNCVIHDLVLYDISMGMTEAGFLTMIECNFINHPFIKAFLANIEVNGEIYFGSAKEWIHKNCTDVPTPRKWEITENIQILYRWIVELGHGKYAIDRKNYSERLFIIRNTR